METLLGDLKGWGIWYARLQAEEDLGCSSGPGRELVMGKGA